MTDRQYSLFIKMLKGLKVAKIGDYTFCIKLRYNDIYQLDQIHQGTAVTLHVGTYNECVEVAKDCVQMMYGILN